MRVGTFLSIFAAFFLFFVAFLPLSAHSSAARRPNSFTRTKYSRVDTVHSQHNSKLFHEIKRPNKHIRLKKTNRRMVQSERQLKYSAKFVPSSKEDQNGGDEEE
uniref:Secreted protein n=1 Tax=Globodera pallida TaxID=36090 RepID=A0A183BY00_GLOPA